MHPIMLELAQATQTVCNPNLAYIDIMLDLWEIYLKGNQ